MSRKNKEKVVKEYSAVLFKADDENDEPTEVAVVPSNWIFTEGRKKYSYWPNDELLVHVEELYNNCVEPPLDDDENMKKWDKFSVKVEEGPYRYKQASEHARRMGDPNREDGKTTDYEDEDGNKIPRKRKQPDRFTATLDSTKMKKNKSHSLSVNQMFNINPEDESDQESDQLNNLQEDDSNCSDQSVNELRTLESIRWQTPKHVTKRNERNQQAASTSSSRASSPAGESAAAPKKAKTGHLTPSHRNIPLNVGLSKKIKKMKVVTAVQTPVKNVGVKKSRAASKKFTPNPPKSVKKHPFEVRFNTSGYSAVPGYRFSNKSKPAATSTSTIVEIDLKTSSEEENKDDDDDENDLADFDTPPPSQKSKLKSGNGQQSKIVAITDGIKRENLTVDERNSQMSVSSFSSTTTSIDNGSKGGDETSQMTDYQNSEENQDGIKDKTLNADEQGSRKETSLQSAIRSKHHETIIIEIAKALQRMERRLYSMGDSQKMLTTKMNDLQITIPSQQLDPCNWNFSLPLQSSQELEKMNRLLREDRSVRSEVFRQCRVLTGTTVSRVTISVMRKLLTSSLGSLYNWKPEGSTTLTAEESNGISFQIFDEIILLISDIVVPRFPTVDEHTFANQFNDGMRTVLKNMRRENKKVKDRDSKNGTNTDKKTSEVEDSEDSEKSIKTILRKNYAPKINDD